MFSIRIIFFSTFFLVWRFPHFGFNIDYPSFDSLFLQIRFVFPSCFTSRIFLTSFSSIPLSSPIIDSTFLFCFKIFFPHFPFLSSLPWYILHFTPRLSHYSHICYLCSWSRLAIRFVVFALFPPSFPAHIRYPLWGLHSLHSLQGTFTFTSYSLRDKSNLPSTRYSLRHAITRCSLTLLFMCHPLRGAFTSCPLRLLSYTRRLLFKGYTPTFSVTFNTDICPCFYCSCLVIAVTFFLGIILFGDSHLYSCPCGRRFTLILSCLRFCSW